MFLMLLPFLGGGFVPVESPPAGIRWFAEYQQFTPIIESIRSLLSDAADPRRLLLAFGWVAAILAVSAAWSAALFRREPSA